MNHPRFDKDFVELIRTLYYRDKLSIPMIARNLQSGTATIKNVVLGKGCYAQFTDSIPLEVKERRWKEDGIEAPQTTCTNSN